MLRQSWLTWVKCIAFALLTGCTSVGGHEVQKGQPLKTPYSLPAEAYLSLANRQVGEEKSALFIMAAGRAIYEGNLKQASMLLDSLQDLSEIQASEKYILLAKIQMVQNHFQAAIRQLSRVKQSSSLPLFYQVQYHEILASSYEVSGRFGEAIGERILLENLLPTEAERAKNRRVLWLTLINLPDAELNTMITEWPASSTLEGWLKLARLAKSQGEENLHQAIQVWQKAFPTHPAGNMLSAAFATGQLTLYPPPQKVALLLPITGALSGPGQAVYEGFMAAYSASGKQTPTVQVYDTASHDAGQLYQQAIADGAQWVIGPLSKPDVSAVMHVSHPVPTILLNESGQAADEMTYFFTLSPLAEAKQIAVKARQTGTQHALVIAPATPWGEEVADAFTHTWTQTGGKIVEVARYENETDLSALTQALLHYSEPPKAQAKTIPPSRRTDFDVVFLVAYPSKARQIMPLLRYYYLGNVPVYATSAVYAGNEDLKQDRDLEGIYFYDMPFIFSHQLPHKHWPEALNSYSRLYALGRDSYQLMTQFNTLILFPAISVGDKSGALYLNRSHEIVRLLSLIQFKQGKAIPLSQE